MRTAVFISILIPAASCLIPPETEGGDDTAGSEKPPFSRNFQEERYRIPGDFDFDATVARWHGFSRAAASLTFDDGTYDQYSTAWPVLEEKGVKGTFYLAAGLIGTGIWNDHGTSRRMMSWQEASEIAASGHEIGSHSMSHIDLSRGEIDFDLEFRESRNLIEAEIPGTVVETFCWPHWRETDETMKAASQYYISARSGNGVISYYYDRKGGIPSDPPMNMYSVNALGILNGHSSDQWMGVAEDILNRGSWFVTSFHGVQSLRAGEDELGWSALPEKDFRVIVDYIIGRGFWIETFATVSKYIYERDAAVLHIKNSSDSLILTLDDDLDDSEYDIPLSLSLSIPENWESAEAYDSEGGRIRSRINGGKLFLDIPPDGNSVIIKPY